ncbi:hypothetical protein N7492_009815 [Penicillium capsulatum]|uniref:Uncharacterized protein n=1 Tax=Penicillium capsulatum TaxID=69766 RepID=A0A9W9HPK1_9EURO|nr:hypothetical protein N7492_009815 [Penicillium capsulatum]KAJ6114104.1 hypothetical protein N7512_007549 [Penicillium capsulatum]
MAAPCIYEHAHDASIVSLLTTQLPHSISLLRRIQHGMAHPSPTAKILATFRGGSTPDTPWLAAAIFPQGRFPPGHILRYVPMRQRAAEKPTAVVAQPTSSLTSAPGVPGRFSVIPNDDFSQATKALYERELAKGENEEISTGESNGRALAYITVSTQGSRLHNSLYTGLSST